MGDIMKTLTTLAVTTSAVATAAGLALGLRGSSDTAPQVGPEPVLPASMTQSVEVTYKAWSVDGSGKAHVELFGDAKWYAGKEALPFERTTEASEGAIYYAIDAQLPESGGHIMCSVTVDGETVTAEAKGPRALCTAKLDMP